jgi:hypothetical protein
VRRIWSHRYKRWRCNGWENPVNVKAVWRDGTCESNLTYSFSGLRMIASLCESWMRENCTSSLGGGRRPAPRGRLLRPDTEEAG